MSVLVKLLLHVVEGKTLGPHLLITGGIHGDEFEPMAAIRRLIKTLKPNEVRGRVTLVPVVNEPAFLRGQRVADDGLDLARSCPGHPDGSITERIAFALSKLIETADCYIDLHTGGTQMQLVPLTGYLVCPSPAVVDLQRRMARAFNLPIIWGTTSMLDGRSLSVARDAGIPAIYCEYLGGGQCNSQGVQDYYDGCLNVMGELGMIDRRPPPPRVERVVEDIRPESGHLQSCHPAPMSGFFNSAIELGQWVDAGTLLGHVTDLLGTSDLEVRAAHSGLVIAITTFCRVQKGQGLVVILGTDQIPNPGRLCQNVDHE